MCMRFNLRGNNVCPDSPCNAHLGGKNAGRNDEDVQDFAIMFVVKQGKIRARTAAAAAHPLWIREREREVKRAVPRTTFTFLQISLEIGHKNLLME